VETPRPKPALADDYCWAQCSNYMEARVCRAPSLLSLPHRAHAVVENLGTDGHGPTLIFLKFDYWFGRAKVN